MAELPLRESFSHLAKHEGVWEGWYRHYDINGKQVDEHRSKLVCRLPNDQPDVYHQTNHYTWEDGSSEIRDFKGKSFENKLVFDNDIIKGWAAQVDLDENRRTMMLHWERVGEPEIYLYEMIQLSDCEQYRSRVWHWIKDGRILQRTLIDEERISRDWQGH